MEVWKDVLVRCPRSDREPLVGRGEEQDWLHACWQGVGRWGRVVLIQGPSGIGKTSVAQWLIDRVRNEGATAVSVAATTPELEPSYGIWSRLADAASVLGRQSRVVEAEMAPSSWYRSALALLESFGPGPSLVLLDDLHGADEASLALLTQLVAPIRDLPVMVLGTLRSPRAHPSSGGRRRLDSLVSSVESRVLTPLEPAAMLEVVVASTSETARPWVEAELDAVVAMTQGNPLLLTHLAGEFRGETPPQRGLADVASRRFGEVALRRLAGLEPAADEVIATIAYSEAVVDVALLEEVHGRAVVDELAAGEAAGLIRVDRANGVDFIHPSFAETVRARSGGSAPAIHARLAQALRRRGGGPSHQVLVMRHLLASGSNLDRAEVVAAAQTTATAARVLGDAVVEAEAYEVLLAHHEGLWSAEYEQLLLAAADAQFRAGQRDRSWQLAAEVMANTPDDDILAVATLGLTRGQDYAVHGARVGNKAVEVARSLPPGHRLVPMLLARGAELLSCVPLTDAGDESEVQRVFDWTVRAEPVRSLVDEAVEIASRDGAVDATTRARLQMSWSRLFRRVGDLPERRRRLDAVMGAGDDLKVQGEVALRLALDHLAAGDADGHRRALDATGRLVRASGDLELAWWHQCVVATLVLARGEPDRAEDLSREAFEIGTRAGEPGRWTAAMAQLVGCAFDRGNPVSIPFEVPARGTDHALLRAGRLWGQAWQAPEQIGVEAVDEVLALVRGDTAREASWTLMSALLADAVWLIGVRDVAEELLEVLWPHRREVAIDFNGFYCAGCVARPLAGLAWLVGEQERCVELELLATEIDGALGLERWLLHGRFDALRRRIAREGAHDVATLGELRAIADLAAARGIARLSREARTRLEPELACGLSQRQRDVLDGLAEQLTYREIADRVGFSHSVVRKEAIAVYAVLGADGRDDAIARARDLGLLTRSGPDPGGSP